MQNFGRKAQSIGLILCGCRDRIPSLALFVLLGGPVVAQEGQGLARQGSAPLTVQVTVLGDSRVEGMLCETDSEGRILTERAVAAPGRLTLLPGERAQEIFFCHPSFWSERLEAPFHGTELQLFVGPSGTVKGTLVSRKELGAVTLRFIAPKRQLDPGDPARVLSSKCQREGKDLTCLMPAGTWLVKVVSGDLAPAVLQSIEVRVGEVIDIGEISLKQGGVVYGRVEPASRAMGLVAKVEAHHSHKDRPPFSTEERPSLSVYEARLDSDGIFTFSGLAPGLYQLAIVDALDNILNRVSFSLPNTVPLELESIYLDDPLLLRVTVSPSTDAAGEPWQLQILRDDGKEISERVVASSEILVYPGLWLVTVSDSEGIPWEERWLEIGGGETVLEQAFDFEVVFVSGELSLGGEPLAGSVFFGSTQGAPRISTESDDAGEFAAVLPRPGLWRALISASDQGVSRWVEGVEVAPDESGVAELSISLPGGCIAGKVSYADAKPVDRARVRISGDAGWVSSIFSDEDGQFRSCGIDDGSYAVKADYGFAEAISPQVSVVGEEATYLDLVLERVPTARLTISDTSTAVTVVVTGSGRSKSVTSGVGQGDLEVGLFEGASGVVIKAPGKPIQLIDPRDLASGDYSVEFAEAGGDLLLVLDDGDIDLGVNPTLTVRHNGAVFDHHTLFPAIEPMIDGNNKVTLPNLQPGIYEICLSSAQCTFVTVPEAGSATVDIGKLSGGS